MKYHVKGLQRSFCSSFIDTRPHLLGSKKLVQHRYEKANNVKYAGYTLCYTTVECLVFLEGE